MRFGGSHYDYRRIESYKDACDLHASIKPVRGRDENERPLKDNRNMDVSTIRHTTEDGKPAVAFKLYRTDVVTFVKGGQIVYENYPSKTTGSFASAILPQAAASADTALNVGVLWLGSMLETGYFVNDRLEYRLTKTGPKLTKRFAPAVVNVPRINQKAARSLLKELNFGGFTKFVRAAETMEPNRQKQAYGSRPSGSEAAEMLRGGVESWMDWLRYERRDVTLSAELSALRTALYAEYGVYEDEPHTSVSDYKQLDSLRAAQRNRYK